MPSYRICKNAETKENYYETPVRGRLILEHPMLNKEGAFSKEEREELGLIGLLPPELVSLAAQVKLTRASYLEGTSLQEKRFFLWSLYERNETLFYCFVEENLEEVLPLIEKGTALLSKPRGIYITAADRDCIEEILENVDMPDVRIFVVGNKELPIGRTILYTLIGGVHPGYVLPVWLDKKTSKEFEAEVKKKFPRASIDWGKEEAKIAALKFEDEEELFWQPRYLPIHCTHALQEFKRRAM